MGGRGRGRGTMSFNTEALGFGRGEVLPSGAIAPPPMFPALLSTPSTLVTGSEQEYLLTVHRDYVAAMRESSFNSENNKPLNIDWNRLPRELRPGGLAKKYNQNKIKPNLIKRKPAHKVDIAKKLDDLGKLEDKHEKSDNESDKDENDDKKINSEDEINDDEGSEAELDDEMDGGTDYANNFFDNGEGFLDEDEENLDEGGIY